MTPHIRVVLAALWWGSLTSLMFWVVPMLFLHLPTSIIAGGMAAKLFATQTWVSSLCSLLLLMSILSTRGTALSTSTRLAIFVLVVGALMAWMTELMVAPRIVARENIQLWHRVGSVMYLLQWVCASATLWRLVSPTKTNQV